MALQEKLVDTKKQEVLHLEKTIQQKSQEIQQKSQEITKQQKNIDEKKKAYDNLRNEYAELVKTKNELAKALNRPKLETQGIVYIQFQGSLERNSMKQLAKLYQQKGFQAPGVERIAGDYRNEVRYFNPSDAELASQVATIAQNFFAQKSCPIENIKLNPLKNNNNVPKGQIELWIHHSCK
jgi:predicted RNase H-like nuclease (RuvC/YqgF family)